ncbi:MAG: hypothetical protein Q4F66_04475 [Clostridium sp.]|nr:hypothetical protein [Clostridium sp.]
MFKFKKITKTNGFDTKNLDNARQNSYAWSMTELGDYIYVGTSRNMISTAVISFSSAGSDTPQVTPPSLKTGDDNCAEIWRYKKDNTCPWQKVFKSKPNEKIYGFRAMITHKTCDSCAIYAASSGEKVSLYKSTDGLHWIKINTSNVKGTSSRALASLNGKLYMAALESGIGGTTPYLYESKDPEMEPFKLVINTHSQNFDPCLNPMGGIDSLTVFNNKLYVGISTSEGAEIWRSNSCTPRTNQWTLIGDKGFGDSLNSNIMSTGIFKNHMYAAITKKFPLVLFMPLGFDLIRIDKCDNWNLIVGGKPIVPSCPTTGKRNPSLSGFTSGFNNLFNVYGWQISEFKDNLILTTYDGSTNIKTILEGYLYHKDFYIKKMGCKNYYEFIGSYKKILNLMCRYDYPEGFDIYSSKDGCSFSPVILDGLYNPNNYGGRTLYKTCDDKLYLGTANPFDGLEVWEVYSKSHSDCSWDCYSKKEINSYFDNLKKLNCEIKKLYPSLLKIIYSSMNTSL